MARLFQTFIHGWEHKECDRAFDAIMSWMETDQAMRVVLSNNVGEIPVHYIYARKKILQFFICYHIFNTVCTGSTDAMQMQVILRTVYRAIFVDDATIKCKRHLNNDVPYWLWTIMKQYGFQEQVRLWYLLFGPMTANGKFFVCFRGYNRRIVFNIRCKEYISIGDKFNILHKMI